MLCRWIILGSLVAGCGAPSWEKNPTREYPYWIDPSFKDEQRRDLEGALRTWELTLNGYLTFRAVDREHAFLRFVPSNIADLEKSHKTGTAQSDPKGMPPARHTIGWCQHQGVGSRIEMAVDVNQNTFQWVALHEVGHSLGLKHTGKNTLMCDVDSCASTSRITDADLVQFHQVWDPL